MARPAARAHASAHDALTRRMCLACGFNGKLLQGEQGLRQHRCPACHADLYARPPRSYAELEGIPLAHIPEPDPIPKRSPCLRRWHQWLTTILASLLRRRPRPSAPPPAHAPSANPRQPTPT